MIGPLTHASAGEILRATEAVVAASQRIFGAEAQSWLIPFWAELAMASVDLPFDARSDALHSTAMFLRAGKWADACASVESIPCWRRQPVPLAWKIEATAQIAGSDLFWPLIAELSWMAPRRAHALIMRMKIPDLTKLAQCFHVEFEGEDTANDYAWFPAWTLIVHPTWRIACVRRKQAQTRKRSVARGLSLHC